MPLKVMILPGSLMASAFRLKGQGRAGTGNAANGDLVTPHPLVPHAANSIGKVINLVITWPLPPRGEAAPGREGEPSRHCKG